MSDDVPRHPGILLKERFLDPLDITLDSLARAIAVPVEEVDDLVAGRRDMTPDFAARLGLFFDAPPRWWLEMQARFDGHDPARLARLRASVRPFDGLDRVLVTPAGVRLLGPPRTARPPTVVMVKIPPELEARLREQARLEPPRPEREPHVVYFEDGTPCLTGR